MDISSNLDEREIAELQQQFYEYFETGYVFEEFLREYLHKMGLEEVEVTQRSRDGGVDLVAIRNGVGDFSEIDKTRYKIQAKRYKPNQKISVSKIRELKGVMPNGCKGMFITTASFSQDALEEAGNDESRPIVVIDGKALVMSCIDNEIGFLYKPVFSKNKMDLLIHPTTPGLLSTQAEILPNESYVEKTITSNDIRARIVSIPSSIMKLIPTSSESMQVLVNNKGEYEFKIVRGRNYFGGVTKFLRDYQLLSEDGVIYPRHCKWIYDHTESIVKLFIEVK